MHPSPSVFTWTSLISAYVECDEIRKAFEMYGLMQEEGIEPSKYTLICLLRACGSLSSLEYGRALHDKAHVNGLETDPFVGSALINMYGKSGDLHEAENVFCGLCYRDIISWSAMISAYLEHQEGESALLLYRQMIEEEASQEAESVKEQGKGVSEGLKPDQRLVLLVVKACSILAENEGGSSHRLGEDEENQDPSQSQTACVKSIGMALHSYLRKAIGPHIDGYTGSALVTMYGKCGDVMRASHVFSGLSERDVIVWMVMLSVCVEQGQAKNALTLFRKMQEEGVRPDNQVFVMMLQACISMLERDSVEKFKVLEIGRALYEDAKSMGYEDDVYIGSALVTLYGKCGAIEDAEKIFVQLSFRDIILWNTMLSMYVEQGEAEKALRLYSHMQVEEMVPDERSFVVALQACCILANQANHNNAKLEAVHIGQKLHVDAQKDGCLSDLFVVIALIDMYGKCGSIINAEQVFNEMSGSNMTVWNAMLRVYAENGKAEKVLHLYRIMLEKCIGIDENTLFIVLQACSEVGSLEMCKEVHFIMTSSLRDVNLSMNTTLIHAYGSCASILDAADVFDRVPRHDVVSWNAILSGLARKGNWAATITYFEKMCRSGIKPNDLTFLPILSACNHYGLLEMSTSYFTSMRRDYGIEPTMEHYASMLDVLVRAGDLVRVLDLFSRMPVEPDLPMWVSLLSACRKQGDTNLAKKAFDYAIQLWPQNSAAYIMMSNIYADTSLHEFSVKD
jgi:pentatricopeptide repeat protein